MLKKRRLYETRTIGNRANTMKPTNVIFATKSRWTIAVLFFLLIGISLRAATPIPLGSTWKYVIGTSEASVPNDEWRGIGFGDSSWASGVAPIGYPSNPPNDPNGWE